MIRVEKLTKSYGGQVLFENTGFTHNPRERIGVVGRNGHGKTTLFRLLTGEDAPDEGTIAIPRHYRVGYVRQQLEFSEDTVLAEGMRGLPPNEKDHHWKVEKILAGLGFSDHDLQQPPQTFSGGYQVRLNLAKVLVSEPDLLLLDEPTNYLDITSIRWIVQFLAAWPRELMLISHDRGFMDRVATHIIGIHRRRIRKVAGGTDKYYAQIAGEEEVYEKTRRNDEKRRREIEQFITRFRAKARLANLVQSRIKTLGKLEKRDKLEKIRHLDFSFSSHPFPARHLCTVSGLEFSYRRQRPLIGGLDLVVGRGERIGVVGPNGRGKTTLLRLLAGSLQPQAGEIRYHLETVRGIFEQTHLRTLVDSRTVEEEILLSHPGVDRQRTRSICGAMMFPGDDALKKIAVLSGGEKSRVMLGKLLVTPVNLLLLDEPTNHLDMESCDALLAALDCFEGTLVMVTHNEMFLHALADRLVVFHPDRIDVFDGPYARFLDQGGWDRSTGSGAEPSRHSPGSGKAAAPITGPRMSRKEAKRRRSALTAERSRLLGPLQKRIDRLEARIEQGEAELADLTEKMADASLAGDGGRIGRLSRRIHACQTQVDRRFEELERVSDEFEARKARLEDHSRRLEAEIGSG